MKINQYAHLKQRSYDESLSDCLPHFRQYFSSFFEIQFLHNPFYLFVHKFPHFLHFISSNVEVLSLTIYLQ